MYSARRRILRMLHDHTLTVEQAEALLEATAATEGERVTAPLPEIVGDSALNREFLRTLEKVAAMDCHVLIQGEPGTGKMLTARALHHHSRRADKPFLTLFCAESPETLAVELLGQDRGTRSPRRGLLELADGGTLFLDTIESCPPETQRQLSAYLEQGCLTRVGSSHPVLADVRLMAATSGGLKQKVDDGAFRSELYYRLGAAVLQTPPLRDRPEDIPTLAAHFLRARAQRDGQPERHLSRAATELLLDYTWPRNVAQLAGAIDRALSLCDGEELEPEHFADLAA